LRSTHPTRGPKLRSRLLCQKARIAPDRRGVHSHDLLQGEAPQIVRTARLRPGAGEARAAERLGADHRADDVAVDVDIPCRKALDDVPDGGVDPGLNAEGKPIAGGCEVVDETVELLGAIAYHMQHGTEYFLPQIGRALQLDNGGGDLVARRRPVLGPRVAKHVPAQEEARP